MHRAVARRPSGGERARWRPSGGERTRWRTQLLLLATVLVASAAIAAIVSLPQTFSATGLLDLRIYLGAADSFRHGGSLYAFIEPTYGLGSTYPPLWSLLVMPLTAPDIHLVEFVWTGTVAAAWFLTLWLLSRPVTPTDGQAEGQGDGQADGGLGVPAPVLVLIWLVSVPGAAVWNTLNQGQINIVLWLLIVIDLRLMLRRRRAAGLLLGLAAAIKLHPLAMAVVLLGARRVRVAVTSGVAFVACTTLAWVVAPDDSRTFWTDLLFDTARIGSVGDAQNNSLRGLLERVGVTGSIQTAVWLIAGCGLLWLTCGRVRMALDARATVSVATAVGCLTSLMLPISWTHHLVFLAFPLLLVWDGRLPRSAAARSAAIVVGLAVLLADPIGQNGRNGWTSSLRAMVMIAVLVALPRLVALEQRRRDASRRPEIGWGTMLSRRVTQNPLGTGSTSS